MGAEEEDLKQAAGFLGGPGEDWSRVPHSKRKDRPLPKDVYKQLQEKSDTMGFLYFFGNVAMIVGCGLLIMAVWHHSYYKVMLVPLIVWQGFLLSALGFACQHECIHMTAFKTRRLNAVVGIAASVPSFSFYFHELLLHKEHHTYTQDIHRDPELIAEFGGSSYAGGQGSEYDLGVIAASGRNGFKKVPSTRLQYYLRFVDFQGYLVGKFKKLWFCACGNPVDYSSTGWQLPVTPGDPNKVGTPAYRLKTEARYQLVGTFLLLVAFAKLAGPTALLLTWIVPAIVGPGPLYFCQIHEHANAALDPNDGLSNTRTTITNPLVSFVMWNMSYHAEHHLYTTLPFHALPKAHELLKDKLSNVSLEGHLGINSRVLREWIPEQQSNLAAAAAAYSKKSS